MLNFVFFNLVKSNFVIVSINEGARKDGLCSSPSPVEDGYCEHEQLNPMDSISAPNRY
jgi:hypothetical protein